ADHGEVVRIVRDLPIYDLLLLAVGERSVFAAHDLGDASSLGGEQFGRRGIACDVAHVEDEIVFMQPALVELDQRGPGALDFLFGNLLGEAAENGIYNPAAGQAD